MAKTVASPVRGRLCPCPCRLPGALAASRQRKAFGARGSFEPLPLRCTSYTNQSIQENGNDLWGTSKELYEEAGGARVRQHINPLKKELQVPTQAPEWTECFLDPSLPLEVDVGCGSGRFLLARARRGTATAATTAGEGSAGTSPSPSRNYLGMDIRNKLVDRSLKWAELLGAGANLHYMTTNATVSFRSVLSGYPGGVAFVSVQYPDPHFKKRHHKRRIVQDDFIQQIALVLSETGHVFLQSDVKEVIVDMCSRFDASESFRRATGDEVLALAAGNGCEEGVSAASVASVFDSEGWIAFNPTNIPTEREVHAQADGESVYRALFRKTNKQ